MADTVHQFIVSFHWVQYILGRITYEYMHSIINIIIGRPYFNISDGLEYGEVGHIVY